MTITWLLDVDGVINADRAGWNTGSSHAYVKNGNHEQYYFSWEPQVVDFIRNIAILRDDVNIVWATTWCPYAHRLERLWSLPKLDRLFKDIVHPFEVPKIKSKAADDLANSGQRFVWTDDYEIPLFGERRKRLEKNGLLISPNERFGLRKQDLEKIQEFIEKGQQ